MRIERVWAMPHKWTFSVSQVADLLSEEMGGGMWIDPFAGENSPAGVRNDIREDAQADFHMDALEFLKLHDTNSVDGVIFDPPYSEEQCLRLYTPKFKGTAGRAEYWAKCKDEIARIVRPGGKVVCFAWDSNGVGKSRGFRLDRVLLVCHGACHNDTIVTVETKGGRL